MVAALGSRVARTDEYEQRSEHVGEIRGKEKRPCGGARSAALHSEATRSRLRNGPAALKTLGKPLMTHTSV
ncbi:hypothetical protein MDS_1660 [Ectopseudomonas mendocina NK-01]|nr:hypothetical protein MDS_1660 [Pseudomonas mendocina NK-01]